MKRRLVAVTIDTEVDKDPAWRISSPPRFQSVIEAVPQLLTPVFSRYGVVPTYLLSPEVIAHDPAAAVLAALGDSAELGTHLHPQFVEPLQTLHPHTMAGRSADHIQAQYDREVEAAKLQTLTQLFADRFNRRPTAFRAGRYGSSPHTLELLAALDYKVDSSITPGLLWTYPEGAIDHRAWTNGPRWIRTPSGDILELPLSVRPEAQFAARTPGQVARRAARRILRRPAAHRWLRPSWSTADDLVEYVRTSVESVLVCMFHSVELVPGASPYASSRRDVDRILGALEGLLAYCASSGFEFVGMTEVADRVAPA